jgi:hypothetical protein
MAINQYTFGKAPACIYLAFLLNQKDNKNLTTKVTRFLTSTRELLNELVMCHACTNELSMTSFYRFLSLIDTDIKVRAKNLPDPFIAQLVTNVLIGELKRYKRLAKDAAIEQNKIIRETKTGEAPKLVKIEIDAYDNDAHIKKLQEKSSDYLNRKGKKNTLY